MSKTVRYCRQKVRRKIKANLFWFSSNFIFIVSLSLTPNDPCLQRTKWAHFFFLFFFEGLHYLVCFFHSSASGYFLCKSHSAGLFLYSHSLCCCSIASVFVEQVRKNWHTFAAKVYLQLWSWASFWTTWEADELRPEADIFLPCGRVNGEGGGGGGQVSVQV